MDTNSNNLFWWILGGGLLAYFWRKAPDVIGGVVDDNFEVGTPSIQFGSINILQTIFNGQLPITNKSGFNLPVDSFIGELRFNGGKVADVSGLTPTIISANSVSSFPFQVIIPNLSAIERVIREPGRGGQVTGLDIVGMVVINGAQVPINAPITVF